MHAAGLYVRINSVMLAGIGFAWVAGMLWGLVFVVPLMLPEYPASLLAFGRYLAFGVIALPMAWLDRKALSKLTRSDWIHALKLAAIGNIVYYTFLASAIQLAGGPLPTMIIGTLPVTITLCANLFGPQRDGQLPWKKLIPALLVILAGLACVNQTELERFNQHSTGDNNDYLLGTLMAIGALICWTWYPIKNSQWLRTHTQHPPRAWATAQGLTTLPLAIMGYAMLGAWFSVTDSPFDMPLGPDPYAFVGLMIAAGLFASWVGTLCWNEASRRVSAAIVGQLIIFETLAALLYAFILRGEGPNALSTLGIVLLIGGVTLAVRIRPVQRTPARKKLATQHS